MFLLALSGRFAVATCGGQASSTQTKLAIGDPPIGDVGSNFFATRGFCAALAISASLATLSSEALRAAGLAG
jgi:hypothetical protein